MKYDADFKKNAVLLSLRRDKAVQVAEKAPPPLNGSLTLTIERCDVFI